MQDTRKAAPLRKAPGLGLAALAALALGAQAPAHAVNDLVNDGGFEQTDFSKASGGSYNDNNGTIFTSPGSDYAVFTANDSLGDGWSVTQGVVSIDDTNAGLEAPHGGTYAAYLDYGVEQPNTLSQTLATTPGQAYVISYFLADDGGNPVTVDFGSQQVFSGPGPANYPETGGSASDYVFYSYTATATGSHTTLSFTGDYTNLSSNYGTMLDDVSVTPQSASPAAVPEPSTLAPFACAGLGLLGLTLRARKRSKAA